MRGIGAPPPHGGTGPFLYSCNPPALIHSLPLALLQSDIPSCKSYLTVIDSVLLPFNPSTLPPEDWLLPSGALGVEGCFVQPNGLITGSTIKAGASNLQVGGGNLGRPRLAWVVWKGGGREKAALGRRR